VVLAKDMTTVFISTQAKSGIQPTKLYLYKLNNFYHTNVNKYSNGKG